MNERMMYFGNRYYMQWIACPEVGSDRGPRGWQSSGQYLHGGFFNRQTFNAAKSRTLSWSLNGRDVIRPINDYVEGVYGEGPIYWLDPFDMDQNMLAQSFATPSLGARDGIILAGDVRPTLTATAANTNGYPKESAVYELKAGGYAFKHWVPVPKGYTAWVGVHGVPSSVAGVTVRKKAGAATLVPITGVTTTNRFAASFPMTTDQDGIELTLESSTNRTVTICAVMVQVLPTGQAPKKGGFISGQGHAGMSFDGYPRTNAYSAALDLVSLTANFIETEQWK